MMRILASSRQQQYFTRSRLPTVVVRFVVNGLGKLGVETGEVLERCGVQPWAEYGSRVPRKLLFDIWETAVQISGQPALFLERRPNRWKFNE